MAAVNNIDGGVALNRIIPFEMFPSDQFHCNGNAVFHIHIILFLSIGSMLCPKSRQVISIGFRIFEIHTDLLVFPFNRFALLLF